MPKFAANLSMLFTELPFLDRFAAAREVGFQYVEFLFPYEYQYEELRRVVEANGLQVVLFNLPSGDWGAGERGIAANPERKDEFRTGVEKAIAWARTLQVQRLNCLAGKAVPGWSREQQLETLVENVRYAADALAAEGLSLMVEPINHLDTPGFLINTVAQAAELIRQVDRPNVYIQFDVYHVQREEGNVTSKLREHFDRIGHIQIADNPGRHQPGTGEINYPFLFGEIDRLGYQGYVSAEYVPTPNTVESLAWFRERR